jgi:AcrR family transcriptional regulator
MAAVERLPHGPHKLTREEVTRHQRVRVYGAVMQAVTTGGWPATKVTALLASSKVSKRTFYEQFSNKNEPFVAVCCLILLRWTERIASNCGSTTKGPEESVRAALSMLVEDIRAQPNLALLAIMEAQSCGLIAAPELHEASLELERMLAGAFAHTPNGDRLPSMVAKGIVGGLHRVLYIRLRNNSADAYADVIDSLIDDMVGWVMLYRSPTVGRLDATDERQEGFTGPAVGASPANEEKTLRMQTMFSLVLNGRYQALSDKRLAEAANLAQDAVDGTPRGSDRCAGKEEYFLATFRELTEEILNLLATALGSEPDRPKQVHRAIGSLAAYLTENPLYAKTIVRGAFMAGPNAAECGLELSLEVIALLIGRVAEPPNDLVRDAMAGAVWHLIGDWFRDNRGQRPQSSLSMFTGELTYIVLAPIIGAARAMDVIVRR